MSLTCMLHSLDRHTVGNQNIITLSHTAANSGVATIQNSRAALTLNFHMKVGATKYRPEGRNWPAGREFETPDLDHGLLPVSIESLLKSSQAPEETIGQHEVVSQSDTDYIILGFSLGIPNFLILLDTEKVQVVVILIVMHHFSRTQDQREHSDSLRYYLFVFS